MTRYRDAVAADLPALDALFRASFTATFGHLYRAADLCAFLARFTPDAWRDDLATARLRVAEEDGRAIGYAKLGPVTLPVEAAPADRELRHLYLADAAKGRGVADALLGWAIDTARRGGAGALFLSVFVDNGRARRFYARHGFVDIGRYDFAVGEHLDEDRILRLAL